MMPGMSGLGGPPDWQSLVGVWWEAMGRACLGGTLILGGAFMLARLLRRVQPGVRCWIWRLAFLKLFLLFGCFLTISLPVLPARSNSGITTQTGGGGIGATKLVAGTRPTSTFGRGSVSGAEEAEMASDSIPWSGGRIANCVRSRRSVVTHMPSAALLSAHTLMARFWFGWRQIKPLLHKTD